jgi:hypothetical protein
MAKLTQKSKKASKLPRIAAIAQKLGKKIPESERRVIPQDFSNRLYHLHLRIHEALRIVFADTLYWIAIFLPNDPWSDAAKAVDLGGARLVTTEEVSTGIPHGSRGLRRAHTAACLRACTEHLLA